MRYFRNSENLMTTTSPRAHPDPDPVRAVGPGRADAPRVRLSLYQRISTVVRTRNGRFVCPQSKGGAPALGGDLTPLGTKRVCCR